MPRGNPCKSEAERTESWNRRRQNTNSDTPNPESSTPKNNPNQENNTQYVKKYRRLRTIWTVELLLRDISKLYR